MKPRPAEYLDVVGAIDDFTTELLSSAVFGNFAVQFAAGTVEAVRASASDPKVWRLLQVIAWIVSQPDPIDARMLAFVKFWEALRAFPHGPRIVSARLLRQQLFADPTPSAPTA